MCTRLFRLGLVLVLPFSVCSHIPDAQGVQNQAAGTPRPAEEAARLRQELKDDALGKHWIYDDLAQGFAQARTTGKPLLVVFR